ncbi:hypothetical protein G6F57_018078 [Rhizopus arrhizus]|nr:hypothetical protein G6F57_018078 [Rhizopus arrhizus]
MAPMRRPGLCAARRHARASTRPGAAGLSLPARPKAPGDAAPAPQRANLRDQAGAPAAIRILPLPGRGGTRRRGRGAAAGLHRAARPAGPAAARGAARLQGRRAWRQALHPDLAHPLPVHRPARPGGLPESRTRAPAARIPRLKRPRPAGPRPPARPAMQR